MSSAYLISSAKVRTISPTSSCHGHLLGEETARLMCRARCIGTPISFTDEEVVSVSEYVLAGNSSTYILNPCGRHLLHRHGCGHGRTSIQNRLSRADISHGSLAQIGALRQGLRDLGYEEGRDLAIEYRWAERL